MHSDPDPTPDVTQPSADPPTNPTADVTGGLSLISGILQIPRVRRKIGRKDLDDQLPTASGCAPLSLPSPVPNNEMASPRFQVSDDPCSPVSPLSRVSHGADLPFVPARSTKSVPRRYLPGKSIERVITPAPPSCSSLAQAHAHLSTDWVTTSTIERLLAAAEPLHGLAFCTNLLSSTINGLMPGSNCSALLACHDWAFGPTWPVRHQDPVHYADLKQLFRRYAETLELNLDRKTPLATVRDKWGSTRVAELFPENSSVMIPLLPSDSWLRALASLAHWYADPLLAWQQIIIECTASHLKSSTPQNGFPRLIDAKDLLAACAQARLLCALQTTPMSEMKAVQSTALEDTDVADLDVLALPEYPAAQIIDPPPEALARKVEQRADNLRDCQRCPDDIKPLIVNMLTLSRGKPLSSELVDLHLPDVKNADDRPCRNHLRYIAGLVGLKTKAGTTELLKYLTQIKSIGHMKFLQANLWSGIFVKVALPEDHEPTPHVRFPLKRLAPHHWDFDLMIERYIDERDVYSWEDLGTLVIPAVVPHLRLVSEILEAEFRLYAHHYLPPATKMGYLRNMIFSLTKQIIRCDPVLYGLSVALRPDQNHRLVSCPYVTKYTTSDPEFVTGSSTGFLHLDTDLDTLVEKGVCADMLTCGVSLDDEDYLNCTTVVNGSHLKSADILRHMRKLRIENHRPTHSTDFSKKWQDFGGEYGHAVPAPAPAYGIRISRLGVIHGSSARANRRRRVIYPWYLGFGEDYQHPENNPSAPTWKELSIQNRDCSPPSVGPTGLKSKIPDPPVHGWTVAIQPPHALGRAILGQVKYEDAQVSYELSLLFHPDRSVSDRYIVDTREKLIAEMRKCWELVLHLEAITAGSNSFARSNPGESSG